MEPKNRYRINSFLAWHEVDGEVIAVDSQEGKVYRFNSSAAEIWKSLGERKSVEEIIRRMSEAYEKPEKEIRKDVDSFLKELFKDDLILPETADAG